MKSKAMIERKIGDGRLGEALYAQYVPDWRGIVVFDRMPGATAGACLFLPEGALCELLAFYEELKAQGESDEQGEAIPG